MIRNSPGPWSEETTMSSDFRHIRTINDAEGRVIADVRYAEGAEQDENLANAKVLAASEALLDALRKAEAILSQMQDNPMQAKEIIAQGYFSHALLRSRAAIAKACSEAGKLSQPPIPQPVSKPMKR